MSGVRQLRGFCWGRVASSASSCVLPESASVQRPRCPRVQAHHLTVRHELATGLQICSYWRWTHGHTVGASRCHRSPQQRRVNDSGYVVTCSHTRALLSRAGHWNLVRWLLIVFGIGKERSAFCPERCVPLCCINVNQLLMIAAAIFLDALKYHWQKVPPPTWVSILVFL